MKESHEETCYFYGLKENAYFKITTGLIDIEWENFYTEYLTSYKNVPEDLINLPILDNIIRKIIVNFFSLLNFNIVKSPKIIGSYFTKNLANQQHSMFFIHLISM